MCLLSEIEIPSFPGFDRSITDDMVSSLELRARIYRNRRIGDFLKELHLIEGRNTGFPNASAALKRNGSANLSIKIDPERKYISISIPVHSNFKPKTGKTKQLDYSNKVLSLIEDNSLTLTEISKEMGYKGITKKLKYALDSLVEMGMAECYLKERDVLYRKK